MARACGRRDGSRALAELASGRGRWALPWSAARVCHVNSFSATEGSRAPRPANSARGHLPFVYLGKAEGSSEALYFLSHWSVL